MSDLGVSSKELYGDGPTSPVGGEEKDRKIYPSSNLSGPQVEKAGLEDCEAGEEYTLKDVKIRVTRISKNSRAEGRDSHEVGFDIVSIGSVDGGESDDEDKAEESALGESRTAAKKRRDEAAPKKPSATDLEG